MLQWLRPLFRRAVVEREMDSELRFHYDQLVKDYISEGLTPDEAQRRARLEFGGIEQVKEGSREAWIADAVYRFGRCLRYALHALARSPGFTAVVILILTLGIGANTIIFSMLDHLALRDLPVNNPERLVIFRSPGVNLGMDRNSSLKMSFSYPKYLDFRDGCDVFDGVAARFSTAGGLTYNEETEIVGIELVSGNYFDVLGVQPALGRLLNREDDRNPMGHPVGVLSYDYWLRRFGGDPSIIGRELKVNGLPITVVGISRQGFHGIQRGVSDELRVPMMMKDLFTQGWQGGLNKSDRSWAWLNILARVKAGVSFDQAKSAANALYRRILGNEADLLPVSFGKREDYINRPLELVPAAGGLDSGIKGAPRLLLLIGSMTLIVLLIVCVNLSGLLITRTASRKKELAVRLALGAGRIGIVRHLLAENLVLAFAGGLAGLLLGEWIGKPVMQILFSAAAADAWPPTVDLRVMMFTLGITGIVAAVFALTPLILLRDTGIADVLKTETVTSTGPTQIHTRKVLIVLQIAFCIWLIIASGLFTQSLKKLTEVDPGFRKDNLIIFRLDPSGAGHKPADSVAVCRRVQEKLASAPGVTATAFSDYGVMAGVGIELPWLDIEGYNPQSPEETAAYELAVTPGFLKALGIGLLKGRDFIPSDLGKWRAVIATESFAEKFFPGQDPVGRRFRKKTNENREFEIVGLVGNPKYFNLSDEPRPFYYLAAQYQGPSVSYYVRTEKDPETMLATIRDIVKKEAPGIPIQRLRTMEQQIDQQVYPDRMMAVLAGLVGLLTTVLAAIGLYGVMTYSVTQRSREIGVRIALGAMPSDVIWMVIREAGWVVGTGLLIGIPSGLALARIIRSQLYNISPTDPVAATTAGIVVAGLMMTAGLLSARRATRIEPITALRHE